MKKTIRALFLSVLTFALVFVLASCGGDDENGNKDQGDSNKDTKVTYTITATDAEGFPVKGVKVELSMDGGAPVPFTTDVLGTITHTTAKKVTAKVVETPAGYTCSSLGKAITFDANGKAEISLVAEAVKQFTIKVVDQNGAPVVGVTVQTCDASGSCRAPKTTNDSGEAFYNFEEGTFYASLTNGLSALPEGYTVADPEAKYYFEGDTVTITVEKLN